MICTPQPVTQTLSPDAQKSPRPRQQQLITRWSKVDGKLICQWIFA